MEKSEIREIISETQDNDVLVREYSDDDFLSRFIDKAIEDADDVDDIVTALDYALTQLNRAKESLSKYTDRSFNEPQGKSFERAMVDGLGKYLRQFDKAGFDERDNFEMLETFVEWELDRKLYDVENANEDYNEITKMAEKLITFSDDYAYQCRVDENNVESFYRRYTLCFGMLKDKIGELKLEHTL